MKFEDLKRKVVETKEREEAEARERKEAEERAVLEHEEEQKRNEENRLREGLGSLRSERERVAALAEQVRGFTEQIVAAESKQSGGKNRLAELYAKIEETLRDADIRRGIADLGKDIQSAESLVADPDFADEADVAAALETKRLITEAENELVRLENDEWQLHVEIRTAVGADPNIPRESDLTTARSGSSRLLEARIRELDREVKELEWQTPEGKEKAEGQLDELLLAERSKWSEFSRDRYSLDERTILRRMFDEDNRNPIPADALRLKEVLGEEKFMEIVRRNYGMMMDELGERYKERIVGPEGYREQKMLETYPEQIKEARRALSEVFNERNESAKSLNEFFKSDEGRSALLGVITFDETLSADERWEEWRSTNPRANSNEEGEALKEHEKRISEALERVSKNINEDAEARNRYAEAAAQRVLHTFDAVAKRVVFNEGWNGKESHEAYGTSFPGEFSALFEHADATLKEVKGDAYYEKLPDPAVIQSSLVEAEDFYKKIPELAKQPQTFKEIYAVSRMIADYKGEYNHRASFMVGRGHERFYGTGFYEVSRRMPWHAIEDKTVPDSIEDGSMQAFRKDREKKEHLVKMVIDFMPQTEVADSNGNPKTIRGNEKVARYVNELRKDSYQRNVMNYEAEQIRRTVDARKQNEAQHALASERVVKIKGLVSVEAEVDVSRAEQEVFESSSDFPAARNYETIKKKESFAREVSVIVLKIEAAMGDDPESEIRFNRPRAVFEDAESVRLNRIVNELEGSVRAKTEQLRATEADVPRGMDLLGNKKKAWEGQKRNLRGELQLLQDEYKKANSEWRGRQDMRDGLHAAGELLRRIAKEFPEDFERARFEASSAGALVDKIRSFMGEFAAMKPSEEEAAAAREYGTIISKHKAAQSNFAARKDVIAREVGMASRY